jgi:hypothetical protein
MGRTCCTCVMYWPELGATGAPAAIAASFGAPWPAVMVLGILGLIVYSWVQYLRHQENMRALDKTARNEVADVLRARSNVDHTAQRPRHGANR